MTTPKRSLIEAVGALPPRGVNLNAPVAPAVVGEAEGHAFDPVALPPAKGLKFTIDGAGEALLDAIGVTVGDLHILPHDAAGAVSVKLTFRW